MRSAVGPPPSSVADLAAFGRLCEEHAPRLLAIPGSGNGCRPKTSCNRRS